MSLVDLSISKTFKGSEKALKRIFLGMALVLD